MNYNVGDTLDRDVSARELPSPRIIPSTLAGMRVDQALARMFPQHSRSRLQTWMREGHVKVDGTTRDPKDKVWGGEAIEIESRPLPEESAHRAEDIALAVVFEDETLLVVDKPAGLVVHPGSGNWQGTLLNALLHHAPALEALPRAGIVHRLDRDTSGLMVVAKTETAQTDLVRQLQARGVRREYLAVVHGRLDHAGTVDAPIGRDPVVRTRMAVVARGRPARTHYRPLEAFDTTTLVECRLDTGRTHQIRVHMRSIGYALVGDPTYGPRHAPRALAGAPDLRFARQALHAARLALTHPVSREPLEWRRDMPSDMQALIERLR